MSAPSPFQMSGTVYRAIADAVGRAGLTAEVQQRASPELARVLARRPLPIAWVDGRLLAELIDIVTTVRGSDAGRRLVLDATRSSIGRLLEPVLKATLNVFGASPASLMTRLPALTALTDRGSRFSYQPRSASAGELRVEVPVPVPKSFWAAWAGVLDFGFELCGAHGVVKVAAQAPDGTSTTYDVSWWVASKADAR